MTAKRLTDSRAFPKGANVNNPVWSEAECGEKMTNKLVPEGGEYNYKHKE